MGDMADFALDEVIEMESQRALYHGGHMSDQKAFELGFLDPSGAETSLAGKFDDYYYGLSPKSLDAELQSAEAMLGGFSSGHMGYGFKTIKLTAEPYVLSNDEERELFIDTLSEKYSDKFISKVLAGFKAVDLQNIEKESKGSLIELLQKLKVDYPESYEGLNYIMFTLKGSVLSGTTGVNATGVRYAQTRDNPTCNICEKEMISKVGKFYMCGNKCEGQKTVSDKYWQEFKLKVGGLA